MKASKTLESLKRLEVGERASIITSL